jgi:hypothetical protein
MQHFVTPTYNFTDFDMRLSLAAVVDFYIVIIQILTDRTTHDIMHAYIYMHAYSKI